MANRAEGNFTHTLLGLSTIADSDGTIQGELDDAEGVLVTEVVLDPARKVQIKPDAYGRYGGGWVQPIASSLVDAICYVDAFFGGVAYTLSSERRRMAQAVSSDNFGK